MNSTPRPVFAQEFVLLKDGLGGFFLIVGRVAVFLQDALDHDADPGADGPLDGPVAGGIPADGGESPA